jgi:arylsulfatase A-like enzyme
VNTPALIASIISATIAAVSESASSPPHIVFVLTDDLGFNYPGYQNGEKVLKTPTLDRLALTEGVRLNSSYMYKYCSPSRGSFLSGRLPWKLANTRCNFIPSTIPEGVDLGYNFLPKHLAKAGYVSSHIG